MSRAREHTTLYAVADDVEMAAEDLRRSWGNETRQRWAIDRQPGDTRALTPGAAAAPALRLARLRAEHESLSALLPPNPVKEHLRAEIRRNGLRNALYELDHHNAHGKWANTPVAEALTAWNKVHYERTAAEANSHTAPLLRRPGFARAARDAAQREAPLEAAYEALAGAERARLVPELKAAETEVIGLDAQKVHYQSFVRFMHPEIPRRLSWLEREMGSVAEKLDDTRLDLEKAMGADWAPDNPSWAPSASLVSRSFPEPLDLGRDGPHRPAPRPHVIERDLGPDLGLGL